MGVAPPADPWPPTNPQETLHVPSALASLWLHFRSLVGATPLRGAARGGLTQQRSQRHHRWARGAQGPQQPPPTPCGEASTATGSNCPLLVHCYLDHVHNMQCPPSKLWSRRNEVAKKSMRFSHASARQNLSTYTIKYQNSIPKFF